jgi:hypothetical protein
MRGRLVSSAVARELDFSALAAANTLRLDPKQLRPGAYALVLRAVSDAGQASADSRLDVRVRR